ncbi:MAG: beta-L-arabinofuranosidase domain-containing protein [Bacteroidota bacterium]
MKRIILYTGVGLLWITSCNKNSEEFTGNLIEQKKQVIFSDSGAHTPPSFIPLPPGAIQPGGWIDDWAGAALQGITGHLDELDPVYEKGWKGTGFEARGVRPEDGTGWPLEQSAYWMDGAVRLAYIMQDSALTRKISERLDDVVEGVLNGGETFIYWKPKSFVEEHEFDNWAHSHMGRAMVAYYQATGNKRILDALVKVYSDYPLPQLPAHFNDISGAVNIDPMLDTYMMSGRREILERALDICSDTGFDSIVHEWIVGNIPNGHGVIFYENIRVPALIYPWTGNKAHIQASRSALQWMEKKHLQPHGVASSEEHLAGVGSSRNTETCNMATSAWTYQKMYEVSGESLWGDRIEKVFFNAAPAAVSRDFQTMCYYQSPNRISGVIPMEAPNKPNPSSPYLFRPTGHIVLCCVGNLNRVIPNYIMHMWMATQDGGVAATLHGPSTVHTKAGDGIPLTITSHTDYPFGEEIWLTMEPEKKVHFPLCLRVPSWCNKASVTVNGKEIHAEVNENGFMVISRRWQKGDEVRLILPMEARIISGNETSYPQTSYFQEEENRSLTKLTGISNPYQSISYGPLLFALPIEDMDANRQAKDVQWNYALNVDEEHLDKEVGVSHKEMPEFWRWQIDAPVTLTAPARIFDWNPAELQPLPGEKVQGGQDTTVTLVPYGCAKFRISMFPVSERH